MSKGIDAAWIRRNLEVNRDAPCGIAVKDGKLADFVPFDHGLADFPIWSARIHGAVYPIGLLRLVLRPENAGRSLSEIKNQGRVRRGKP